MTTEARFLTGSTMGHVVRMTMTSAVGITFVFLVDAANLFWISQLGDPKLMAAIGFAFAIQFFSVSSGVGLMIASTALISRQLGKGNPEAARREAAAALVITTVFQALMAFLIITFRWQLLDLAGATGETRDLAARYLLITLPSLAVMAVGLVGTAALRAHGDGKRAMYVTLISGLFAIFIDPALIVWAGLGLDGAAYAILIFRVILAGAALYFTLVTHKLFARPKLIYVKENFRPFLAIALPAMVAQMSTPFGGYLLTALMAQFGDTAVAAWAVVNRLYVVAFGGIFSLSGAIGGIFGQNYGAKQYDRLWTTFRDAVIFCIGYALVAWVALMLATPLIIRSFGLSGMGETVMIAFTFTVGWAQGVMGLVYVTNAAFNTLGRPNRSMAVNWTRDGLLLFPLAYWAVDLWGAPGVLYGQAIAGCLVGVVAMLWAARYVKGIPHGDAPELDLTTRRGYRDVNRFRRR